MSFLALLSCIRNSCRTSRIRLITRPDRTLFFDSVIRCTSESTARSAFLTVITRPQLCLRAANIFRQDHGLPSAEKRSVTTQSMIDHRCAPLVPMCGQKMLFEPKAPCAYTSLDHHNRPHLPKRAAITAFMVTIAPQMRLGCGRK